MAYMNLKSSFRKKGSDYVVSDNIYAETAREMMREKTKEHHRDLQRDLEICERAEWNNDKQFIAEAREGWPHAIRRALAAEKRVAELEAENARLREQLRDLNEYKRLAEWGLRKIFGEERVVRHGI